MGRIYRIAKSIAALAGLAIAAASCTDSLETPVGEIRFSAGSGVGTKTTYSGEQTEGRERVDWNIDDLITIYCYESPTPVTHIMDYKVTQITSTSGYYSLGKISKRVSEIGLRWADDDDLVHHFYAINPSNYSNSSVSLRYYADTHRADYIGAVPTSQPPVSVSADANGNYTAAPNMLNLIMVAQKAQSKSQSETVTLDFKPVVTAVDFTVQNGYADEGAMTLSAIRLSSSDGYLAGRFSGYYDDTESTVYDNAGKSVEIPFSTPVSIAYGKTLKFTIFLLGDESTTNPAIDNMTIEFVTGETTSIQAFLKTTQGNITFPRSKKSYVSGLIVPGACVWAISAEPDVVVPWNENPSQPIDVAPTVTP